MAKQKKHERIRDEIERMDRADNLYCDINNCAPTDFMNGKKKVYVELLKFINKL